MQNFSDNVKQEAIDILLGTHTDTFNVFTLNLEKEIKTREKEFSEYSDRTILIVTWNLGGAEMPIAYDLNQQLLDNIGTDMEQIDIVIFGLQEMVISSSKIISGSEKALKQWSTLILNNLNQKDQYFLIKAKELLGLGLFIYAKERFKERITKVSYDTVKLGFMGQIANKGAVVVKMYIDDTLLCLTNAHFEHGQKSLSTRLLNLQDVHSQAFNTVGVGKRKEEKIEQCDYKFLFGDLNFRINLPSQEVITLLQKLKHFQETNRATQAQDIMKHLQSHDELQVHRKNNLILQKYREQEITFTPTYKYEPYSNLYDSGRTPSWTDRIMVWANENMEYKQSNYKRHEINYSDHRPVSACYTIKTHFENQNQKEQILKEIYEKDAGLKIAMNNNEILREAEEEDEALIK